MEENRLWDVGGIKLRRNRGITLVEVIIALGILGTITVFFWTILNSSSRDSYTITDKMYVQNSVAKLMNTIEQDIKEANIYDFPDNERGIITNSADNKIYVFSNDIDDTNAIRYTFDSEKYTVEREKAGSSVTYDSIISFSMEQIMGEKYGAKVDIIGGKDAEGEGLDKTRYSLSSTYYTRNTL